MKKENILEVLKEIRDLLKTSPQTVQSVAKPADFITIKDDGRKTSEIINECRKLFNIYCYLSDEELNKQFPPVKSTRKFKNVQEADEENANKSANDLIQEEQITLRERLIMEIQYFKTTGNHLDIINITLCAGSRSASDDVPLVYWFPGYRKVQVNYTDPGYHYRHWRSRSVQKVS